MKVTEQGFNKSQIKFALNEAIALASVGVLNDNKYIVRYVNCWIEQNKLHLVMELCSGSLRGLISTGELVFNEAMARKVLRDLCKALKHIHSQGIVHLDIKPDNILYSKTGQFKLADLGLTRLAERNLGEDVQEGDCRYMASELLDDYLDERQQNDLKKADIFSLGATIYELMMGQELPKNGPRWHQIRNGDLWNGFNARRWSESVRGLVSGMVNPDPSLR